MQKEELEDCSSTENCQTAGLPPGPSQVYTASELIALTRMPVPKEKENNSGQNHT